MVPLVNAIAAKGLVEFERHRGIGGLIKKIILFFLYSHAVANLIVSAGFLYVSSLNYPGGEALSKLHQLEPASNRE